MKRNYLPTLADLIDRLGIVTLKSIKIYKHKKEYEEEAQLIMKDIKNIIEKLRIDEWGQFIRASMVTMLANEIIWKNESEARKGKSDQDKLLKFTHSVNGVRNNAKNVISQLTGERKDLKLDCLAATVCQERGYDFGGIFK
jgi:hypothetical protein